MLTAKQHELLNFIHERLSATGVSPSFDEMREALDLKSKSGVHRLISALEERQFIRRLPNRARALEVLKVPEIATPAIAAAPVALKPAGPAPANDTVEIPLHGRSPPARRSRRCRGRKDLRFRRHCSARANIMRWRFRAIRWSRKVSSTAIMRSSARSNSARDGEIVVALIDNEEATLKTYRREGQMIRLDPANRSYEPQRYDEGRVTIQGRLAGLIRRY